MRNLALWKQSLSSIPVPSHSPDAAEKRIAAIAFDTDDDVLYVALESFGTHGRGGEGMVEIWRIGQDAGSGLDRADEDEVRACLCFRLRRNDG